MPAKIRFTLFSLALLVSGQGMALAAQATTSLSQMTPIAQPQIASGSAMIVDLTTNKVLFPSHPDRVRPIASITKLMTAMAVLDAHLPMNEMLTVDVSQTPEMLGVFSRVKLNSQISRRNMLLLALMSSENRAATSLAHAYPGGYNAFIRAMNAKTRSLGMKHTRYVEPTGLSTQNVSNAEDLIKLLKATREYPLLGALSTTKEETAVFAHPAYALPFRNTNHLVYKNDWHIQLTKTGYTDEAGHCLVMRTMINNRPAALVVLDAFGKYTHFADVNRLRDWIETGKVAPVPAAVLWPTKNRNQARLPAMAPAVPGLSRTSPVQRVALTGRVTAADDGKMAADTVTQRLRQAIPPLAE